jgi:hypothetical protein
MDGFEIMTWVAASLFVILGIGLPDRERIGSRQEPGSERDGIALGDDDGPVDRMADSPRG